MSEQFNMLLATSAIDAYQQTAETPLANDKADNYKKVYSNLTKMLEECYFVGPTRFGNNFIA